jgi:hypothetical protein
MRLVCSKFEHPMFDPGLVASNPGLINFPGAQVESGHRCASFVGSRLRFTRVPTRLVSEYVSFHRAPTFKNAPRRLRQFLYVPTCSPSDLCGNLTRQKGP